MSHDGAYRGPFACAVIGITYRQLDYWARTGLVRPSVSEARGSGSQRLYSFRDLLELRVVRTLLDAGISLQSAREALDALRYGGIEVASTNLVLSGNTSLLARDDGQLIDLLKGGQGVLNIVLPLAGVVEKLEADIRSIEMEDA